MLETYGRVLRAPHVAGLVTASVIARLPISMAALGIVLYVRARTGSFAAAGLVSAAFAVGAGASAPVLGRLVDRLGLRRVLVPGALVDGAALSGIVVLGALGAPTGALAAAALTAGLGAPPVGAALRTLWPALLAEHPERLAAGYALDSVLLEVFYIGGPVLAAGLATAVSPSAPLIAAAFCVVSGTLWFCASPAARAWRGEPHPGGRAGALASPGIRVLALAALPAGACFGALEIAFPAFGGAHGSAALGGAFLAAHSAGSLVGGALYGVAAPRLGTIQRGYVVLALAFPATTLLLLVPPSVAVMLVLAPLAGLVIAPLLTARIQLVGGAAPRGTLTEAFTWVLMANIVGAAGGSALGGVLVESGGWRAGVLAGCAAAGVAAAVAVLGRSAIAAAAEA